MTDFQSVAIVVAALLAIATIACLFVKPGKGRDDDQAIETFHNEGGRVPSGEE